LFYEEAVITQGRMSNASQCWGRNKRK
jgi:hypothetical protein